MPGYQRFVAYVYEYRKGKKEENCGFIRVEARDEQCGIEVHVKCPGLPADTLCEIKGIVRTPNQVKGVTIGSCMTRRDEIQCRISGLTDNLDQNGIGLVDIGGILLITESGAFFGTEWDDVPIIPEDFLYERDEMEEKKNSKEALPDTQERESQRTKVKNNQMKEIQMENKQIEDNHMQENQMEDSPEEDKQVQDSSKEDKQVQDSSEEDKQVQDSPEEDKQIQDSQVQEKQMQDSQIESNQIENNQVKEKQIYKEEVPEMNAAELTIPDFYDNNTDTNSVSSSIEHEWEHQQGEIPKVPDQTIMQPQASAIRSKTRHTSIPIHTSMPPFSQKEESERTSMTYSSKNSESSLSASPSGHILRSPAIPVSANTFPEVLPDPSTSQNTSENFNTSANIIESSKHPDAMINHTDLSVHPERPASSYSTTPNLPGTVFTPFTDGEITDCRKIHPQDLRYLAPCDRPLRNNRFLAHGYYIFNHIIIGKTSTGQYIIGVPGGYDQQERFMAGMHGFHYFKASQEIRLNKTLGGYWYRLIHTPNFHQRNAFQ